MREPSLVSTVAWRVAAAAAFVSALSLAPISIGRAIAPRSATAAATTTGVATDLGAILPEDPMAVVEAHCLGSLARGFLGSGVHARLIGMEAFRRFEKTPAYAQLLAGLSFAQLASGLKPTDLAAALLGEQLIAAVVIDGSAPGLLFAVRTGDADVAEQLVRATRSFAAMNKESEVPPRDFAVNVPAASDSTAVETRGATATAGALPDGVVLNGKLWVASIAGDVVAATSEALLQAAIARDRPSVGRSVAATRVPALLERLRASVGAGSQLRVALDVAKVVALKPDHHLLPAKSDNSGAAFLFGDLLCAADRADVLFAELELDDNRAHVRLHVPSPAASRPPFLRSFGHARAELPLLSLLPRNTLATLSLRRDGSQFWQDRGELCDGKTEREFVDMKANLGLFFGGRSLPDEVLPQLDDELLFILTRQTYPDRKQAPLVRGPAGAFVYRTRGDAAKLGREFASGMQAFIALYNADGAQKRETPLLLFVEPFEGVTVYGGRAIADDDRPADAYRQNLSPSVAWVGDRIVLSSSEELLHDLVRLLKTDAAALVKSVALSAGCTAALRLDGPAIATILRENRESFVANAVLDDGKPRAQAELEIDLLIESVALVAGASLEQRVTADAIDLALELSLLPVTSGAKREGS